MKIWAYHSLPLPLPYLIRWMGEGVINAYGNFRRVPPFTGYAYYRQTLNNAWMFHQIEKHDEAWGQARTSVYNATPDFFVGYSFNSRYSNHARRFVGVPLKLLTPTIFNDTLNINNTTYVTGFPISRLSVEQGGYPLCDSERRFLSEAEVIGAASSGFYSVATLYHVFNLSGIRTPDFLRLPVGLYEEPWRPVRSYLSVAERRAASKLFRPRVTELLWKSVIFDTTVVISWGKLRQILRKTEREFTGADWLVFSISKIKKTLRVIPLRWNKSAGLVEAAGRYYETIGGMVYEHSGLKDIFDGSFTGGEQGGASIIVDRLALRRLGLYLGKRGPITWRINREKTESRYNSEKRPRFNDDLGTEVVLDAGHFGGLGLSIVTHPQPLLLIHGVDLSSIPHQPAFFAGLSGGYYPFTPKTPF
jgi:hypothetical protein